VTAREYYRGMPYGEFCEMIEQRRHPQVDPAPPMEPDCTHPFDWLEKTVTARRNKLGLIITVAYRCAACDADLGITEKQLRSKGS
jgi:hypothetical protein